MDAIRQFANIKVRDQLAFLIVVASFASFAVIVTTKVLIIHPFETTVFLIAFAVFAKIMVAFMWGQVIQSEQPTQKGA